MNMIKQWLVTILVGMAVSGYATDYTFDPNGPGSADWWVNGNWTPAGIPNSVNDRAIFNASVNPAYTTNVHPSPYAAPFTMQEMRFDTPSNWTLYNNDRRLRLQAPSGNPLFTQNNSGTVTLNTNLELASNTVFGGSGSGPVTLNGSPFNVGNKGLSGPGNLIKQGTFTLALQNNGGSNSGTHTGQVIIDNGTVRLAATARGFNAGYFQNRNDKVYTVNSGGTLEVAQDYNLRSNNTVNLVGGVLDVTHGTDENYLNLINTTAGTIQGNGIRLGFFFDPTITSNAAATSSTIAGPLTLVRSGGNGDVLNLVVNDGAAADDLVISGQIRDLNGTYAGQRLIKTGDGKVVLTNTGNSWDGGLSINGGTVSVSALTGGNTNGQLGGWFGTSAYFSFDGGTLEYTGPSVSGINRAFTINAGGATIAVTNPGTTLGWSDAAGAGPIVGAGGLTKTGPGMLLLPNNNSYTGLTDVAEGTLQISGGGGDGIIRGDVTVRNGATFDQLTGDRIINSSAVTVETGGTWDLNGGSEAIGTLAGGGLVDAANILQLDLGADATFTGTLNASEVRVRNGNGGGTQTFAGDVNIGNLTSTRGNIEIAGGTVDATGGIFLGQNTGGINNNLLTISGGTITTPTLFLGESGGDNARVVQTDGTVNITGGGTNFRVGHWGSETSTYDISGGSINAPNARLSVGWDGGGEFTQTGGDVTVRQVYVDDNGSDLPGTYTLDGGTLTVGADGILNWGNQGRFDAGGGTLRASGAFGISAGLQRFELTGTNDDLTIDTNGFLINQNKGMTGAGGLVKVGAGDLNLLGSGTYSGGTTISAGRAYAGAANAFGTGTITLDGGTLRTAVNLGNDIVLNSTANTIAPNNFYRILSGQISGPGGFTLASGGGTPGLELNNPANNFAGDVTINGGTYLRTTASEVIPNTASVTNNGNLRLDVPGGGTETIAGLSGSGEVWIPTNNNNVHTLVVGANDASSTYTGIIGSVGQNNTFLALRKIGTGTLTLNPGGTGQHPATGGVEVSAGTLLLAGDQGFNAGQFAGPTTFTVSPGATLRTDGAWSFSSNNDAVVVNGGTLQINNDTYLNDVTLNNGATLNATGGPRPWRTGNPRPGVVTSSGSPSTINGQLFFVGSGSAPTTTFTVADGPDATDLLVNANIVDHPGFEGAMDLVKSGSGTMTLTGVNTYGGDTLVNGGTLLLNGTNSGAGQITVASGATLGGTGSVPNALVLVQGSLAPGNSPGILGPVGSLAFPAGSSYEWEIVDTAGAPGPTGWDLVDVTGGLTIADATDFSIDVTGLSSSGPDVLGIPNLLDLAVKGHTTGPFEIATYGSFSITSGTIDQITVNAGNLAQYGYFTLSNNAALNQLELIFTSTVPEPGTWAILGLLLVAGIGIRRRRHQ